MVTHLTALDYGIWAIQIALEVIGLTLAFRKSLWALTAYLSARLLKDAIDVICIFTVGPWYELSAWVDKIPEYAFEAVLTVSCLGGMLRETRETVKNFAICAGGFALVAVAVFYVPVTYTRMLKIEEIANYVVVLAIVLCLATERTKAPWTGIGWGVLLIAATDGLCDMLMRTVAWNTLARLYGFEIVGLIVLAYAAYAWEGNEARIPLGVRHEGFAKGAENE